MKPIAHIFWNSQEKRLRAFWRLFIQGLIAAPLLIGFQFLLGTAGLILKASQGSFQFSQINSSQAVQEFFLQDPLLMMLMMLATGLSLTISVWLASRFLDRRRMSSLGLRLSPNWWYDFGFGLLLGAFLMLGIFLLELAVGWISIEGYISAGPSQGTFFGSIMLYLATFILVGIYEELFSRGYQLTNLAEGFNNLLGKPAAVLSAVVLSSLFFGLLHAANPNADLTSTLNIGLAGVLLSLGYILTGSLAIPIGLHITWNFFQGNVFGFPVSGGGFHSTSFISISQSGPDLWTGGAFGPEGGLIGLIGIAMGAVFTLLYVRLRYGKIKLHLDLAAPPPAAAAEKPSTPGTETDFQNE